MAAIRWAVAAIACALPLTAQTAASIAVINARIWTGNPKQPWAEALLAADGKLVAVGSTAEVRKRAGDGVRTIDARGRMVVPGFSDSHVHFITGGFRLSSVQLRDVKSREQFAERMRNFAATVPKGTWITGGDWDHTVWGGTMPSKEWIDAATPDHPVLVNRLDGHSALANSKALALASVTKATKEVAGGTIDRDASGEPTGVLRDNAIALVRRVIPEASPEMYDRALDAAMKYVAARGVTSVHNMGDWADLAALERARRANRLRTRVYTAVPLATWARLRDKVVREGRGDEWLRWGMLKGFVDGSLGSHTAAMLEPFSDARSDKGLLVTPPEKLYEWTSGAAKAGLQVAVHAIGDRAIRTQLDVFERVNREQSLRDARFRIEHAQHIAPADIARFGKLGVIASMQPYHAIDDGRWAEKVIGKERAKGTYAFRSLLDTGATIAFGSDWFVAPPTPLEGIYAAVTRQTLDDRNPGGWVPEQKITVEEALRAYTTANAYAGFEEKIKGSLETGKLADFVILEKDITKIPAWQIRDVKIVATVVGGSVVYE
jgi:predicted amidohydrolase YtcJ